VDARLRSQLLQARDGIVGQLMQLEATAIDPYAGGPPDHRSVYADLQRELKQIDDLLAPDGHDGEPSQEVDFAYEPMTELLENPSAGSVARLHGSRKVWAWVSATVIILFAMGLIRELVFSVITALN